MVQQLHDPGLNPTSAVGSTDLAIAGVTGLWRPSGVLDRWRMRDAPVLARARVRSSDPIAVGALVALPLSLGDGELWARVLSCRNEGSSHLVSLGFLGEP